MTHLEFDFDSPIWRHLYRELSREYTLVRYDARATGLSDREVEEVSFEAFVRDLEAVVDAAGLDRFALLGISQGCAVSIAYATRHPEHVTRLILYGGYARGGKSERGLRQRRNRAQRC
jgi:pimeloyl-ACP methyl ester carboxylesterase